MNKHHICIAGEGWGFVSAYKSFLGSDFDIDLLSNDPELLSLKRSRDRVISKFQDTEAKLIICAGYKPIIPKPLLEERTFINIHYSLLPKYRGLHSTVWAILNNEPYLGLTIHLMDEFIDNGPIIHQKKFRNKKELTSRDYMELFNNYIEKKLSYVITDFLAGKIVLIPQDKTKATFVGKRSVEDCRIPFEKDIHYINNMFRALVEPYPLPFFSVKSQKFFPRKVNFHRTNCITHIGRILNIDKEGIWIKCADSYVIFDSVMDESNCLVPMDNFRIGQFIDGYSRNSVI